jgi:adenylate kinase family enzyme
MKKIERSLSIPSERDALGQVLGEWSGGHVRSKTLEDLSRWIYEREPVDVATFVTSKDYLNKPTFWPVWLKDLEEFFQKEHWLAILRGAIGSGKTTFADVALAYMIYQLSCLRDPAAAYGLLAGSTVALIMVSINMKQAQRVLFKRLKVMLEASPYFRETFPARWAILTELRFPKSIWVAPVASNEQNVLGENIFGGAADEGNFMPVIEDSKQAKGGQQGVYDRAQVLFDAIRRRMLSRFPGMPGRFILLSAEQYPEDFIDRTCRRYQDDPEVMVRRYTQWETRPREQYYSQASFAVEVGTEIRPTRILTGSETDIVGEVIKDIPIELKKEIEDDPEGATRDILGRSTLALTPFITDRQSIRDAVDPERVHPMTDTETTLRDGVAFVWERLCERGRDQDGNEVWHPRWHPDRLRYVHIDLGLTNDRAGLAMGCCVGTMEMRRRVPTEDVTKVEYTTE